MPSANRRAAIAPITIPAMAPPPRPEDEVEVCVESESLGDLIVMTFDAGKGSGKTACATVKFARS